MAINISRHDERHGRFDRKASVEYHLIFSAVFVVLLFTMVLERMMPWTWLHKANEVRRASVISRAWDAAQTCTAYAFMG
ncbi:hypothetical protein [Hyphomicrobium sp. ghe19]|uniref:hypothetical protein n=1 Tax=Hyphomicrobium sp. ghe19 TaxID=2682968 RepID=UPI0013677E26|nr:hypothetical protein HYPP_02343 [Hyphomicrobium sp. ghe19]